MASVRAISPYFGVVVCGTGVSWYDLTRYAILSDDVVIADQEVAKVYESALATMGVTISYKKSLMSLSGSAEFAKRSRVSEFSKDVSLISIRNLMNSHHSFGLMAVQMKDPCQRFSTLARGGGAGFRQLARLDHYRNLHFERERANS
jgi:hypothetical protein